MPPKWDSKVFRGVYEDLVKQMDQDTTRSKCFSHSLISREQRDNLSHLKDSNHNRELLKLLETLNDDDYEVFCQVLLENTIDVHVHSVTEMRKAPGAAAASASTHSQAATPSATALLEGNPLHIKEYRYIRMQLTKTMGTTEARNEADGNGLITPTEADSLITTSEAKGRVPHNVELLRMIEAGGVEAIRKFSNDVLPTLGQCATHKPALDTVLAKYK